MFRNGLLSLLSNMFLGVILEYELRDKSRELKEIDLLHLTAEYVSVFVCVYSGWLMFILLF